MPMPHELVPKVRQGWFGGPGGRYELLGGRIGGGRRSGSHAFLPALQPPGSAGFRLLNAVLMVQWRAGRRGRLSRGNRSWQAGEEDI